MRPCVFGCAGTYSGSQCSSFTEAECKDIIKAGGMKAQDAALKSPECFDSDAEELLSWFNTEVGNRGKRELLASRG